MNSEQPKIEVDLRSGDAERLDQIAAEAHLDSKRTNDEPEWSTDPEELSRQIQAHPDFEWQKAEYEAMVEEGLIPGE